VEYPVVAQAGNPDVSRQHWTATSIREAERVQEHLPGDLGTWYGRVSDADQAHRQKALTPSSKTMASVTRRPVQPDIANTSSPRCRVRLEEHDVPAVHRAAGGLGATLVKIRSQPPVIVFFSRLRRGDDVVHQAVHQ